MGRLGRALLGLIGGYILGVALGVLLVSAFSPNTHDKSMEVAMTSAFVTGPVMAIIGLVAGLMWRK
jgi:hypothetical protein